MSKEIYISSTPHETRLAIVEKDELSEIYYERENEYTLAGSIYNGRVTRVLPGMQSAFVDVGLERDAFLYITDFLEEQGESADFESAPRGGNGDRTGEPNDRGGDRGRGDRQRGGRPREAAAEAPRSPEPVFATPPLDPGEGRGTEAGEDGAGEGSRTWRGRRGRRRGRGGEGRTQPGFPETTVPLVEALPDYTDETDPHPLDLQQLDSQRLERLDGQAEEPAFALLALSEDRPSGDRGDRGGRGRDRERGDRSGRGRDRFKDRGRPSGIASAAEAPDEEGSAGAEPLILPGESLSKYRRGGSDEPTSAAEASVGGRPQANLVIARPSTEIDLATAGWDGGSILPGETLSRYRGGALQENTPAPKAAGATESAGGTDGAAPESGRNRRRDRDARRGRSGRPENDRPENELQGPEELSVSDEATPTSFHSGVRARAALDPSEAVQPGVTSQHEPDEDTLPFPAGYVGAVGGSSAIAAMELAATELAAMENLAMESQADDRFESRSTPLPVDLEYVPETDMAAAAVDIASSELAGAVQGMYAGLAATPQPAPTPETGEQEAAEFQEFEEQTTEYEPGEDASASYRVEPGGTSEFRRTAQVAEDLSLSTVTEASQTDLGDERFDEASAGLGHEFTAIQDSGEMLSELPDEVAMPGAQADPTNPIEAETAVQSMHLSDVQGMPQPTAEPAQAAVSEGRSAVATPGFAPGEGQLEEELLDDEDDGELFNLVANDGGDTEEETFEVGADIAAQIGSLARERALEQMARAEMATADDDDEDDFDIDEEEMEEDELDGSEEIVGSEFALEDDDESDDRLEVGDPSFEEEGGKPAAATMGEFPAFAEERSPRESHSEPHREPHRERSSGQGDPRRDLRRGGEGRGRGGRDRRGMANGRPNGGQSGRAQGRTSMQNTDLPAISDLLKPGQEVLVQIAKEPIAKKGARITSHIALPGRFLVFMPTVNHVGVSRKIESDGERRRLKEVLLSEKGEATGGFIVRTAALGASEEELRSDLRFLLNLWADIKQRSEASKSPALIYHDLNLVERILRDQVTDNFSAIWVDTEDSYERVLRFLQRFQPALMRRVKLYTKDTPLFEQFGIAEEINKALRSKVWLKSGGSIVINQTEALVAIDINTGKFVGKTARLEDTIVKTNLDAIPEIVRQIRLRDLGGIIVIDFIDMDDRKNRARVLQALEEELKNDRAPSKVLQFNDFGLVAITRKRVKQSLERTLSTTCTICAGTGMVKSAVTVCNEIYIELRKMHKQLERGDVMLRVHPEVVKQLKSGSGKWLQEMEEISGKTILVKSDPSLHPEQFDIH